MNSIQENGGFRRLIAKLEARKHWEAQHPELAAAWSEALREDHIRTHQREVELEQARLESNPRRLLRLGVPERTERALGAVKSTPAMVGVRQWLKTAHKPFLALLGQAGCGKSVAAAWALRSFLAERAGQSAPTGGEPREEGMWVAAADLAALSTFTEADREWLHRAQRTRFLVLDDFGAEALHEHAQARLERLVDARYGNNLRTVLTTNADVETLRERAGARIVDRLRECAVVVNCGAESLRGRP